MNVTKIFKKSTQPNLLGSMLFLLLVYGGQTYAQELQLAPNATEIKTEMLATEVMHFAKPIRLGTGKRAIEYQEALVLTAAVDREQFDSLPPSMEPFLYIGANEYRIHHIDREDQSRELILTFHIRDWEELQEGAPVVLTIDHGAPIRNPERFIHMDVLRFNKATIIDNR